MKNYLGLLISHCPSKNHRVSFETLYKDWNNPSLSFEEFKLDLIQYMKKKIKKFVIKNNTLTIECFTKANINELVKYYKIGDTIKEVNMDLLYNSWVNPYDDHKHTFINKLEKKLIEKDIPYFIFDNALHIKE